MSNKTLDVKLNEAQQMVSRQTNNFLAEKLLKQKKEGEFLSEYGKIKALLSSNSEQLEGSTITYQETSNLLQNSSAKTSGSELNKLEMLNHFKLFDYMLESYSEPLTKELILKYHAILKAGAEQLTLEEERKYVRVGRFKAFENTIGGMIPTTSPEDVENAIEKLIFEYNYKKERSLKDILDFHYRFETIHPFYDGNGRIGRMLMFKECLANDLTPFILSVQQRMEYGKALREYPLNDKPLMYLCLNAQTDFKRLIEPSAKGHEKTL